MIFSEENDKIAPALVKSWGDIENPKHNATVKVKTKSGASYTFDYTDLNGIFDEAKRVLKENGVSVIQSAFTQDNKVGVVTTLLHSSGQYVKSDPLLIDASHNMQDMGGQITYMKRYSLSAMLGISTEKDDDGNGAVGNEYQKTSTNKASDKQLNMITKLINNDQERLNKMLNYFKVKTLNEMNVSQASSAIKMLQGDK